MKQKTSVNEVEIGMYVSELDRPWGELPFEPPFEVQGFVVSSEADLSQIKKYCQYVFIDTSDESEQSATPEKHTVRTVIEEKGGVRNVRFVSPSKHKSSIERADRSKFSRQNARIDRQQNPSRARVTRRPDYFWGKWWEKSKKDRSRRRQDEEQPAPRSTVHNLGKSEPAQTRNSPSRKKTDILFIEGESFAPVYPVQCSIEEEIANARDVVNDTFKVYENVVHEIQAGRAPNADAVKQTVTGLVQSVIRNPDALTWLVKMKQQDNYTYYHSMAVCVMALTVGRHLGLPQDELNAMGTGTLLQDIGKIRIPKGILDKTGELTSVERQVLRQHVETGIKMLDRQHELSNETMEIVRSHHERHDGSGYPKGIHGGLITPTTTIAAMADTFQALTSHRPYRPAMTSLDALTKMYELGDGWFPQAMVEHLIQCVGPFPIGTFVMLNTGAIAVVISPNRIRQLKPQVMVVSDSQGNRLEVPESIDLSRQVVGDNSIPWKINRVVDPEEYGLDAREFFLQ